MDTLRWDDLRVLLAVVRRGSFTAAATELGVEQSTVSRRTAALERWASEPLFDRVPGGLERTELAHRLLAHAERVESEVQAAPWCKPGWGRRCYRTDCSGWTRNWSC